MRRDLERTVLYGTGSNERHDHGDNVHSQLELEELGDAVVDIPPPHDGLDDAGEVVVGEDDVASLLGHVRAGDPHREPDIRLLEGGRVVGSVSGDGHHLPPSRQSAVDDAWKMFSLINISFPF